MRHRAVGWSALLAAALGAALLLAPPMGTDLAAQVARVEFFDTHGWTPVDLRWYGGTSQFGYSVLFPALGALFGVMPVAVVASVVAAAGFAYLLVRSDVRRPLAGGLLGAATIMGNLVSGRTTFALGLGFGMLALCALVAPAPARPYRLALAALGAALATLASPVAGLFTAVAGGALLLCGAVAEALAVCGGAAVAVAPMLLFGTGGRQPFTPDSMKISVALAVAVAFLVPARYRAVRIGAALAIALLLFAYAVPTALGSNALRLPMLFAVPLVAGLAELDRRWLVAALVGLVWWQPPVMTSDLGRAGSPESRESFYRPLVTELRRLDRQRPVGRVEVVPLRDHWESAYVARAVPLARGWERQADAVRNPLFYRDSLDPDGYGDWLSDNAVAYVAWAPGSVPDRWAREEAAVVGDGPGYLREVWRDARWRLYEVTETEPLVSTPATLVDSTADRVVFDAPATGPVTVRVRWNRWLALAGPDGCGADAVDKGTDGWTTVHIRQSGRYTLSGGCR